MYLFIAEGRRSDHTLASHTTPSIKLTSMHVKEFVSFNYLLRVSGSYDIDFIGLKRFSDLWNSWNLWIFPLLIIYIFCLRYKFWAIIKRRSINYVIIKCHKILWSSSSMKFKNVSFREISNFFELILWPFLTSPITPHTCIDERW